MDDYGRHFSNESFWEKVKRYALKAGSVVLRPALTLYFALQDEDTPAWAKAVIVGALGYFVFPMDAIPDMTPGVGFVDDLGALTAALGMVAVHVKHEHTQQSSEKLREWFGNEGNGEPEET